METPTRLAVLFSQFARDAVLLARGTAFWTAVVLPLAVCTLVVLDSALVASRVTLLKLSALNVFCLVAGHGHGETGHHHE